MSFQSIKQELHKHIGKYADYASEDELKAIKLDDKVINLILAKKTDWVHDDTILSALEICLPDHKYSHFAKPINDIVSIMDALIIINMEHKNKSLSVEKSYKYTLELYENMCPDEMILYKNLVELNYTTKKYSNILILVVVLMIVAILMVLLLISVNIYSLFKLTK